MKKYAKLLVLLLSVALVVGALAMAVSADDTAADFDLAAAIEAAEDEGTVTMTGNATISSAITVGKNLTIDLGGYTLTSSAATAFSVTDSVNFKITGTGAINLDGELLRTASGMTPTVTVEGNEKTYGINIHHTGSASMYITYTYTGNYTYKNLNIVTDSTGVDETATYDAFIHNHPDAAADATYVTLDSVEFHAEKALSRNPGIFIVSCAGKDSKLTIKNSGLYTTGSGIQLAYAIGSAGSSEIADIQNSVISCVYDNSTGTGYRTFGLIMDLWSGTQGKGTVNLTNSLLESTCRTIFANDANADCTVNAVNSTINNVGANSSDNVQLVTRYVHIKLDKDSKLSVMKSSPCHDTTHVITASVGTRLSSLLGIENTKGIKYPDGSTTSSDYVWVYDPVGNSEFPYVLKEEADAFSPNYAVNYSFEHIYVGNDLNYRLSAANTKQSFTDAEVFWIKYNNSGAADTAMQWDVKMGSLYLGNAVGNNYVRYVVTNNCTSSYTITLSDDGKTLTTGADPYLVVGGSYKYAYNKAHVLGNDDYSRAYVAVLDFDFGSDSEYGYPKIGISTQTRVGTGGSTSTVPVLNIANDGTLTNSLDDAKAAALNPTGEWNHMTAVYYTDNSTGCAYLFLNGEYIGYCDSLYTAGADAYICGLRFNISKNTSQTIDSAICFDNVSFRSYTEYLFGEEDEATSATTAKNYVTAAPASKFINESFGYSINGITQDTDINTALEAAATNKTVLELNADVPYAQTIAKEGILVTNGYSIEIAPESLGYVISYDSNGNEVYTFDEDYKYTASWYVGDLDKVGEATEGDFVSTTVKLGYALDYNFSNEMTYYWTDFTVKAQNGWAYEIGATDTVTPMVPGLEELEAAKVSVPVFYPVISSVDMTYYVKNTEGYVRAGYTDTQKLEDLCSLADGETFVMLDDVVFGANSVIYSAESAEEFSIDLAGHALILDANEGALIQVGANTTLNVYSSVPGAQVIATNGLAFVINDGTNYGASSEVVSAANIAADRASVNNAYINVGKATVDGNEIPGANMVISANIAFNGYKGGENCAIVSDGVDIYSTLGNNDCLINTYVFDGDIYVVNCIVMGTQKNNLVNLTSFSVNSKNANERNAGFEDFVITSTVKFENAVLINMLSGLSNGSNNNVISNNGDSSNFVEGSTERQSLFFKNVVSTGRLNPSNENKRNHVEGYLAAETYAFGTGSAYADNTTYTPTYNVPMTWALIPELGITDEVLAITVPDYSDGVITYTTYNIANNGVSTEGLANAYNLPILDCASDYTEELAALTWEGLAGGEATYTQYYVKGAVYSAINKTAATAVVDALGFVHDGTWTNLPEAGDIITDSISFVPGYKVVSAISGLMANLSIYSDFGINVYIPVEFKDYITSITESGSTLVCEEVTVGETSYLKVSVKRAAKEATKDVVLTLNISQEYEGVTYTPAATVSINVASYAAKVLAADTCTDADKALMNYMIAYANEAAKFQNKAEDATLAGMVTATEAYEVTGVVDTAGYSAALASATVDTAADLAYVFTVAENFAGTVEFKYAGITKTFTVTGGEELRLGGMKVYNFAGDVVITATAADGTVVLDGVVYNLATFVNYHAGADCEALAKAFYNYAKNAYEYMNAPVEDGNESGDENISGGEVTEGEEVTEG